MNAPLLRAMVVNYENSEGAEKSFYLDYVQTAMDNKLKRANGVRPNTVASAHGFAFLWKELQDEKYLQAANKIYEAYLKIPRTSNGGVTHLARTPELWDDTMYMIGIYLLEMYRATGEEKYLDELMKQFRIHREKLSDPSSGLWVHGWDDNNSGRCTICGQRDWPNEETRRSEEVWGRGNGWIVVMLSDIVKALPKDHPSYSEASAYLKEMIVMLPDLQDEKTGHWYQLPLKPELEGNFIESSSTAMFSYGILTAIQHNIVESKAYEDCIHLAYEGLRKQSLEKVGNQYLNTKNVCIGTCIGDEEYYLNRKSISGKAYAIGMFIIFGTNYELEYGM
jgi:unsaturated rhamnogalacturonyl hydrolase